MSNFPEPSLYLLIGPRLGARFIAIQVELLCWFRAFANPAAISFDRLGASGAEKSKML